MKSVVCVYDELAAKLHGNGPSAPCSFNLRHSHGLHGLFILEQDFPTDKFALTKTLSVCCKEKNLEKGKCMHALAVIVGFDSDAFVATAILSLYGKCGTLDDAHKIFDVLPDKDVVSWNAIISADAKHGRESDCLHLFDEMHQKCVLADKFTLVSMLSACASLENTKTGQRIHAQLAIDGCRQKVILDTALIHMYSKCKDIKYARSVFDGMEHHDTISWNTMISGYAQLGYMEDAFHLFHTMSCTGMMPNMVSFIIILDACAALPDGQMIHTWLIEAGYEMDVVPGSALVNMYCAYSCLHDAHKVFDSLLEKNLITWNCLVAGYTTHNCVEEALKLFNIMQNRGINPDRITWSMVLGACAGLDSLAIGEWIYNLITIVGLDDDNSVVASAIKFYGNFGSVDVSQMLFSRVSQKDFLLWNSLIMVNAQQGLLTNSFELLLEMHESGLVPDYQMFVDLLGACAKHAAFFEGSCLEDACCLFERVAERTALLWTSLIGAYAHSGNTAHVVYIYKNMRRDNVLFDKMEKEGVAPDEVTFVSMLSACSWKDTLPGVTLVHNCIVCGGFEAVSAIVSSLIHFYGKLKKLEDACYLFDRMLIRNLVAWNAMITGHTEEGRTAEAIQLFVQMQHEGVLAEKASYVCTLNACNGSSSLLCGKRLHVCISSLGFSQDIIVNTALVSLYGRCCSLEDACTLFYRMPEKDEISWSAFIRAFSENGSFAEALQLFERMLEEAFLPNLTTFLNCLHACTEHRALSDGLRLHARILCSSFVSGNGVTNAIQNMYGEFGRIVDIERNFSEMQEHDVISCNVMIKSYVRSDLPQKALQTFFQMGVEGLNPDMVTLASVCEVCGSLNAYFQGKVVHISIIHGGISHVSVNNAAVTMYSKCGHLQEALEAFNHNPKKTVASWNAIISTFCNWEYDRKALEIFVTMLFEVTPDVITFATVLCACRSEQGRLLHYFIVSLGFEQEVMVGNSLISMYGRCASSNEAESVFERLPKKNTATWNAMLTSNVLQGATNCYSIENMQRNGVSPNEITFASALDFCGSNNAPNRGRFLHMHIILCGFELDINMVTSLVNLYGKCGMLKDALIVFKNAINKNLFTWTAMIAAYACYGLDEEALLLLMEMEQKKLMVDKVTIVSILSAFGHSGSLDSGEHFLFEMLYNNIAELDYFNCMIDLLSRMGQLTEAEIMIWSMPFQPTAITWTALVGACQTVGDVDRASCAVAQIVELNI